MTQKKLQNYVISVVIFTLFVILWGAYVRATGSGAGCGSHWPLCNGQVIPLLPELKTKIEFFHRITSGLSLPLVLLAGHWGFHLFPKGSFIRKVATVSVISIILEALIGAALVLFELVSHDQSLKRTISVTLHFSNTLILVGSLALLATSSQREGQGWKWKSPALKNQALSFCALFFTLGMAGAITALGDTLFPAQSLAHGLQQDLDTSSHFLVRLRVIHPILAAIFALFICPWITHLTRLSRAPGLKKSGYILIGLIIFNLLVGVTNLVSLAPIPLQLFHLCLGLSLWISFVLFIDQVGISEISNPIS